ncbi:319_t:CDS:2, partial [Paraglomus occultum]
MSHSNKNEYEKKATKPVLRFTFASEQAEAVREFIARLDEYAEEYDMEETGEEILKSIPGGGLLSKSLRGISHVADRGKDWIVDDKIKGIKETTSALQNSQSLLEGQITDLQTGLQEAKDRELELAAAQQRLASELANTTEETKAELELQKQALEEAIAANNTATEQIKTALQATQTQIQEVQSRMDDSVRAIEILQDASLSQEEKINSLNELVENERQRMDAFENQMANLADHLEQQETQLNQHSEQINSLHQKHTELEKK